MSSYWRCQKCSRDFELDKEGLKISMPSPGVPRSVTHFKICGQCIGRLGAQVAALIFRFEHGRKK